MRGKGRLGHEAYSCDRDHPRLCGEKSNAPPQNYTLKGSPPPMRGKVRAVSKVSDSIGITPAYAGKSCCTQAVQLSAKDHPRLCGEKCF